MKTIPCFLILFLVMAFQPNVLAQKRPAFAIAIHGGAGNLSPAKMDTATQSAYKQSLTAALIIGETALENGASAIEVVEMVISALEDDSLFNAGRGAVFNHDGFNELDASIMNGSNHAAGAISGVRTVKNPIQTARAVMDHSNHVLLSGEGAEAFAKSQGKTIVDPSYFRTEKAYNALQKALNKEAAAEKHGTVGCVVLDNEGHLAAGTSTGGMTNKRWNRVGDTPIIGAGTWADDATCAVSCTGHGEFFIRWNVARDVSARMQYGQQSLQTAAEAIIMETLVKAGGEGGLIALDKDGNISMVFNTPGMFRASSVNGKREVSIFKD